MLGGDYQLDLSFQRGCGQNIETIEVICRPYLFSLGYKSTVGLNGWGSQGESDLRLTSRRDLIRQRLWLSAHDQKPKHEQQLAKRERHHPSGDDVFVLGQK